MRRGTGYALALVAVAAALGAGYWMGGRGSQAGHDTQAATAEPPGKARKLLYYRNPMGLPDTSQQPKKDAMGMDYIPVYEGDALPGAEGQVHLDAGKVQKLGVKTEAAELREVVRSVRAAGRIEADERRIYSIAPKFEGWIEALHVSATGDIVRPGQALFEVYSPELVSAQREYVVAEQGAAAMKGAVPEVQSGMRNLAQASLLRLKNWDIGAGELKRLRESGEAKRTLTYRSPVFGVVLEKTALKGMRFMPGEMLYKIADLSAVWIIADVPEQDGALVRAGQAAKVRIDANPGREFAARVAYVYPTLNAQTRTIPLRLELANAGGMLRPGMYASVELSAKGSKGRVVTVPDSAVIRSGRRDIVLLERGEGRYEPREVTLGAHADDYVEVRKGVAEGEKVVVGANFLIDAESNLKAALGGLAHAHGGGTANGARAASQPSKPAVVGHKAQGTLNAIHADGTVSIAHEPIATLGWPGMTMDFALANPALAGNLKAGSAISFEIVERKPDEWVVTSMQARPSAPAANPHAGH